MSDYVATNTMRVRMTQTGPRGTHKMTFRFPGGTAIATAMLAVSPIVELMQAFCCETTTWASAEFAAEGSEVFLPTDWTPIMIAAGDRQADNNTLYGAYINFTGRTTAGSRVAFYLFNVYQSFLTANNRIMVGEKAALAPLLAAFAANSPVLCGIDQNSFVMKAYANTGINDRVAKKSRSLA